MTDKEKLIRFVLEHPELIDWLDDVALSIKTQQPVHLKTQVSA